MQGLGNLSLRGGNYTVVPYSFKNLQDVYNESVYKPFWKCTHHSGPCVCSEIIMFPFMVICFHQYHVIFWLNHAVCVLLDIRAFKIFFLLIAIFQQVIVVTDNVYSPLKSNSHSSNSGNTIVLILYHSSLAIHLCFHPNKRSQ